MAVFSSHCCLLYLPSPMGGEWMVVVVGVEAVAGGEDDVSLLSLPLSSLSLSPSTSLPHSPLLSSLSLYLS